MNKIAKNLFYCDFYGLAELVKLMAKALKYMYIYQELLNMQIINLP